MGIVATGDQPLVQALDESMDESMDELMHFDNLAEAVADILVLVDEEGRLRYINPAGAALLGMDRSELMSHSVFEAVHRDDLEYARRNFKALTEPNPPTVPIRLRLITADRTWHTIEMIGNSALDDPELRGIVVSGRDITDFLAGNKGAEFDANRLRHLIDASGDLVVLLGRDDRIEFINAAVTSMLGYTVPDLLGTNWPDLVHPDDLAQLQTERDDVRRVPGATMHADMRLVTASGDYRQVEVRISNERDNPAIEGMVISARDVTLLRRAQARLSTALTAAEVGVAELDSEGRISNANDVLLRMTSSDAGEIIGRHLGDCFEEEDGRAVTAAIEWLTTSGETAQGVEGRWRTEESGSRWVLCRLSGVRDESGRLSDFMCFITDITRRKENESSLRELNEELARFATHDALTDLANRFLFNDHLERALARSKRAGDQVAVLFCDLDWFKEVNDTYGHSAGDEVLVVVANRLKDHVRPSDVLARLGGDEFAIFVGEFPSTNEVITLANRLVRAMEDPIRIAGAEVTLGLSVGIAISNSTSTPTSLLQEADRAVYEAKARGRGRYAFARAGNLGSPTSPSTRRFG